MKDHTRFDACQETLNYFLIADISFMVCHSLAMVHVRVSTDHRHRVLH